MATIQRLASYFQPLGTDPAAATVIPQASRYFSVLTYQAKGDGIELFDGVTNGTSTFTSASAAFSAADVGKPIAISQQWNVTNATNANPIVVTVGTAHGMTAGRTVTISGVLGNTAANGVWVISSPSGSQFTLVGSQGNGAYTSGGTAFAPMSGTISQFNSANSVAISPFEGSSGNDSPATATGCRFLYGTDDTTAFTNAIAAAAPVKGTVYVPSPPAGTRYIVRHPIYVSGNSVAAMRLSSGMRLTGDGPSARIQLLPHAGNQVYDVISSTNSFYQGQGGSTGAAPSSTDTDIQIDNLTINGSAPYVNLAAGGATEHGIYLSRTDRCTVRNVQFENCGADGCVVEFSTNFIANGVRSTGSGKAGIYLSGSANCQIKSCNSDSDLGGYLVALGRNCVVSGNSVKNWGNAYSVTAGIMLVADSRYCSVTGNTVRGGVSATGNGAIWLSNRAVGATPTPVHGIAYGSGADPTGAFPYAASFNTVTGNTVSGNGGVGIFLSDYSDFNDIIGNDVSGSGNVGIQLQASQYNNVIGNKVYNNTTNGVYVVSSSASRPASHNKIESNEISDVKVYEFTTLTGTATTNGTTTLTGSSTLFTTEIGSGAISPAIPIIISGDGVYNFVTNVASNTSLTLQTAATTSSAGHALSGPKTSNQITHPSTTQTTAILESNVSGTGSDFNEIINNKVTGAVTLAGATTKIYAHQGGTSGRISATADVTINSTSAQDITGATTGTFTALHTGSMVITASVFANIASGSGLGNFLVIECQVSTNGGAYSALTSNAATNIEAARTPVSDTWVVQLVAGSTYAIKLTGRMTPAATTTYAVFGSSNQTGFTYRFV